MMSDEHDLAIVSARIARGGIDEQVAKAWLRNNNTALRGVPAELIQSISGLVNVIQYLDTRRAKI